MMGTLGQLERKEFKVYCSGIKMNMDSGKNVFQINKEKLWNVHCLDPSHEATRKHLMEIHGSLLLRHMDTQRPVLVCMIVGDFKIAIMRMWFFNQEGAAVGGCGIC
uniref:Uncharacterized protein n=1 Tax=Solanum lycopersicum TaxID=4081 RepID=A0A3Q7IB21_SOLLC